MDAVVKDIYCILLDFGLKADRLTVQDGWLGKNRVYVKRFGEPTLQECINGLQVNR